MIIIDRRENPRQKSVINRQRALNRSKQSLKETLAETMAKRSITTDTNIKVSAKTGPLEEPTFRRVIDRGFTYNVVGSNKIFVVGDKIPKDGGGSSSGSGKPGSGEGQDDFSWMLSQEEYLSLLFEGLELPDLMEKSLEFSEVEAPSLEGLSTNGSPSKLSVVRSLQRATGRKLALKRPTDEQLEAARLAVEQASVGDKPARQVEYDKLIRRRKIVGYIDPVDLRYRYYDCKPVPRSSAVVFLLMDVSGSMTENRKDIAKRFFLLFYTFLNKKYKNVAIVFIRHTEVADEVDENTFFYDNKTGGTRVSPAYELMLKIQAERYPSDEWNIYLAHASDGDNYDDDSRYVADLLQNKVLPTFQHSFYIEVGEDDPEWSSHGTDGSNMLKTFKSVKGSNFTVRRVTNIDNVYPTFRDIFTNTKMANDSI